MDGRSVLLPWRGPLPGGWAVPLSMWPCHLLRRRQLRRRLRRGNRCAAEVVLPGLSVLVPMVVDIESVVAVAEPVLAMPTPIFAICRMSF